MKTKIAGGVLLWRGVYEDYHTSLICSLEVKKRLAIIRRFESGELSLKKLNEIWR